MLIRFTPQITYNNKSQEKETPETGEITKKLANGVLGYVNC